MPETLFPETEPQRAPISPKERLMEIYAILLVENPPVKALTFEYCPDADQRMRLARRLAAKDVPRILTAMCRAKLEIGDAGRVATMKEALADWLTACLDDAASGGNGSERVDVDALIERTRAILGGQPQ